MLNPLPLRIDIVSDVVCPWCIIGYKQLQLALPQLEGRFQVRLFWHPFELNPQMPPEGQEIGEHLAQKYGSGSQQVEHLSQRLGDLGERLGFKLSFVEGMRIYNTFKAHQLLYWAESQNRQTPLKLALFEAYFSRRENISDDSILLRVAESIDLDASEAQRILITGEYASAVRQEQKVWIDKDVHAVPTFFFNNGYSIPGAQEADTFVRVLKRILERELTEEEQ